MKIADRVKQVDFRVDPNGTTRPKNPYATKKKPSEIVTMCLDDQMNKLAMIRLMIDSGDLLYAAMQPDGRRMADGMVATFNEIEAAYQKTILHLETL